MRNGEGSDGLIQRFQLLIWPDKPEKWVYKDSRPDAAAFKAAASVYRRIAGLDEKKPLLLRFSDDAQAFFVEWLTNLMNVDLLNDELHSSLESHFSKYRSLMPSLALLFSLADECTETVGLAHSRQAAAWCDYLMGHATRVYSSRMTPAYSAALVLKSKLEKGLLGAGGRFTLRELRRKEWRELAELEQAKAAVAVLVDHGWVRPEEEENPFGIRRSGRPSDIYAIHPTILKRRKSTSPKESAQKAQGS
jgi:putative DNA primase/helicase